MRFTGGDYKAAFAKEVEKLSYNNIRERSERIRLIDELIEEYVTDTGKVPDAPQLARLTNAILYEDLQGDSRPNKSAAEEEPILTHAQVKRRQEKEVGGDIFEVIGSDGKKHAIPNKHKAGKQND